MLKKIRMLIERESFWGLIKLGVRISVMKVGDMFFWPWNKAKLRKLAKNKKVIVITKTIEWNYAFQRTQQLAVQFSKDKDVLVIYITRPISHDFFFNMKKINESLYCFSYSHYLELNDVLENSSLTILYMTNLLNYDINIKLKHDKMVYEYIDELSIFFDDLEYGKKIHNSVVKEADLVIATAVKLYDEVKELTSNAILSENAGDYDFFSNSKNIEPNEEVKKLANEYECLIGYYGMMADWFDFELVKRVAKDNPNWAWILIGPRYANHNVEQYDLNTYKNIYVLGPKPYKSLPSFIKDINILTIPFKLNEITASTSPVKLFEYMAASKPIITSDLLECRRYKSVNIYHNKVEFENIVKYIMNMDSFEKKVYLDQLEEDAQNNTWLKRKNQIFEYLFKEEI